MKSKQKGTSKQSTSSGSKQSGNQGSRTGSQDYSNDKTVGEARQTGKSEKQTNPTRGNR